MGTKLTWLGHGSWSLEIGERHVVLDPFLDDSPVAPVKSSEVAADYILVSHGHFDHVADVAKIAHRTAATVVAIFEIAEWFAKNHGVQNTIGMNIGGGVDLPFGRVKLTQAFHSSQLPDGSSGGQPAGFLLSLPEGNVYFACDTGLFGDMREIGSAGIELAVLPIGDLFTMGPDDALEAVRRIKPRRVAPAHYNTWPPIEQDAQKWAQRVQAETDTQPVVLAPGESIEL